MKFSATMPAMLPRSILTLVALLAAALVLTNDLTHAQSATASAPSIPTLTAQAKENGIFLSWEAVPGAARYELMTWWNGGPGWQTIGGARLTGTSYTHTTIAAGTTYHYTIRALNAAGEASPWLTGAYPSAIALAATGDATATPTSTSGTTLTLIPTPTSTATATPTATASTSELPIPSLTAQATDNGILLDWEAVSGAVRYELLTWWNGGPGWQVIGGANLTSTFYTHTAVTAGTTYHFSIRALNAAGNASPWLTGAYPSATARASTVDASATPTRTSTLAATATPTATASTSELVIPSLTAQVTGHGIVLSWDTVPNATRYELLTYWDPGIGWQSIGGTSLAGTTYTHTDITAGTTYYYSIRALDATGQASSWLQTYPTATAPTSRGSTTPTPTSTTSSGTATPTPTPTISPTPTVTPTVATTEIGALIALYDATGGDSWKNNDNWLSGAPIADWYGVHTDDRGRVLKLYLSNNLLKGQVPNLSALSSLRELSLSDNQLNGPMPDLSALTELRFLTLSSNNFTGPISDLSALTDLGGLSLSNNQLTGPVVDLRRLRDMQRLYLYGNQLTGPVPDPAHHRILERVSLGNNFCLPAGTTLTHSHPKVDERLRAMRLSPCTAADLAGFPAEPKNLTTAVNSGHVTISWDPVADSASYDLWVWDSLERRWSQIGGPLTTTSYTHPVHRDGRNYYFQVRARNAAGQRGPWTELGHTIIVPGTYPPPPSFLGLHIFYQKYLKVNGVVIVAPTEVSDAKMKQAGEIVAAMFSARPTFFENLTPKYFRIALFRRTADGRLESQIPELWADPNDFGGAAFPTPREWMAVSPERDRGNCYIFIHEFAHTVQYALEEQADGAAFKERVIDLYESALDAGLWNPSYAKTNIFEYWAQTVTFWFHGRIDEPSSHRGSKLEDYDPEIAKLITETFGEDAYIPSYCKP